MLLSGGRKRVPGGSMWTSGTRASPPLRFIYCGEEVATKARNTKNRTLPFLCFLWLLLRRNHMADALREQLARILDWKDAHAGIDDALDGIPPNLRGVTPEGGVHSLWQLLEHMRLAQFDILDFCRNSDYQEPASMEDYWPEQ